jgi:nucleoside-diphosphate-sugar epimerase
VRVVITGASGNLGTALLEAATAPGGPQWDVLGVARRRPEPVPPYDRVSWECCDIGVASGADRLRDLVRQADVVVHLAWAVQPAAGEPPMRQTNLTGTRNLLRAVAGSGVRHLVCASSVAAYRPAGRHGRVAETWSTGGVPGSAYSRQKAELETMLDGFEAERPEVTVARVRPCAIVSRAAGAQLASWLVSPLLPTWAAGRVLLPLPVWPGLRLQAVHARDVADGIRLIVAAGAGGGFNLAAEPVVRRRELAAAGITCVGLPYRAIEYAATVSWRAGLQPLHRGWLRLADRAALVDTTRARHELGWTPTVDATAAVREMIEAVRHAQRHPSPPLADAPARRQPFPQPWAVRIGQPLRQSQHAR